jgi:hypothetical protein
MTVSGPADLAACAVSMQQDLVRNRVSLAMVKQDNQAQRQLVDMIDRTLRAAPASGTGEKVDLSV